MYQSIKKLQSHSGTIFQISNDALYFSHPASKPLSELINLGNAFGTFRDEYPGQTIHLFVSFGAKSCSLKMSDASGKTKQIVKARGFSLRNIPAAQIISNYDFKSAFKDAISGQRKSVAIPQIRKRKNIQTLSVKQVLMSYQFSNCISATRVIFYDGSTEPYGYK